MPASTGILPATTAASGTAAGAARAATGGFGGDFRTFLTMLTTQLQNQDPTNAMSPEQMTAQLVQFAQVEQQIRVNDSLQRLIGLQQAAQLTATAPLLGRMVEVESDRLSLQEGRATLRLPAAGVSAQAEITVQDAAGRTLRQAQVTLGPAAQDWVWDGRDAAGRRLPDGVYRFTVSGRDAGGGAQPLEAAVRARATGAERRDGELRLVLGALEVGFDKVRSLPQQ